jgi:hypothetical protein
MKTFLRKKPLGTSLIKLHIQIYTRIYAKQDYNNNMSEDFCETEEVTKSED